MQKRENTYRDSVSANPLSYVVILEEHLKRKKNLNDVLFNELDKQINPLSFAVDLFYYSNQKYPKKGKPGKLPIAILESLKEWCKNRDVSHFLTRRQKIDALDRVLQFPSATCIKLICEIFHLEDEKEHVKHGVSRLLSEKKFKVVRKSE